MISEPEPHDVLFDSGSRSLFNAHTGNKIFRDLINAHVPDYLEAERDGRHAIINTIVNEIRTTYGGRFLTTFHVNDAKGWYEVDGETCAGKVAQAVSKRAFELKR